LSIQNARATEFTLGVILKKISTVLLAFLVTAGLTTLVAVPARAADFQAELSKSAKLNPIADSISVNVQNLAGDQGIYVRLCAVPADQSTRPSQCDGQGIWASNLPASNFLGAAKAGDTLKLSVKSTFTLSDKTVVNCLLVACAVHTRRDHFGGATDLNLDRYYPISFATTAVNVSVESGFAVFTVFGHKSQKLTFSVAGKTYTRSIAAETSKVKLALPAGKKSTVSVLLGKKQIFVSSLKG
jgi:hypothetical protein